MSTKKRSKPSDVQLRPDLRGIEIDNAGVKDIRYPIVVLDRANGVQHTVANINMFVTLPHQFKGTHMSRFVEVLNLYRNEFSIRNVAKILAEMKARLDAGSAHIEFTFPYFIKKAAPVSGLEALMEYGCRVHAMASTGVETVLEVSAPITTLCPCSKEISRAGAHNQRGTATVAVTFKNFVWIEDMVAVMEGSASCETYALLKREDEAFVTERAYDNPKFVEDVVRDMATKLMKNPDITWFSASAEAQESIHNHNAYAQVEREKTEGARPAWWRYHVR